MHGSHINDSDFSSHICMIFIKTSIDNIFDFDLQLTFTAPKNETRIIRK